jgi:hypothetical protein
MDIDILETSTKVPLTCGILQFGEMELGIHTPYKPSKVENLKKFIFDKSMA